MLTNIIIMTRRFFQEDNFIKNMPVAISGTLLATLSLGNLLNNTFIKAITFLIGIMIIITLLLKTIFYTKQIKDELDNPIVLSTAGTFTMALMVLSTYLQYFNYKLALAVWITAVIGHLILILRYTQKYFIQNFNIENYYGSLWIVYIGYTMGAISGGMLNFKEISWIFSVFGFIIMIPTILLVSYRYMKYPVKIDANKPLICIYTAIFNILNVGYLNSFTQINVEFTTLIYIIACCFYVFSLYKMIKYIQLPFYPSYSAFTFPFVISAMASSKLLNIYPESTLLTIISITETIIAVILVTYVLYEYLTNIVLKKQLT